MDPRQELVSYLRRQLVGPVHGDDETLDAPPDRQYLMGTLYPQEADLQGQLDLAKEEFDGAGTERGAEDAAPAGDPVPESNSWLPSSLGFTFYTDAETLEVECSAARYLTRSRSGQRGRTWQRVVLPAETHLLGPGRDQISVLDGRAELRVRRRNFGSGKLVTVALVNVARHDPAVGRNAHWDGMLFQVELRARPVDGQVLQYPSVRLASRDPEEQELRLQYRHVRTHAVGHGCAVEELRDGDGQAVTGLRAAVMPEAEVTGVRAAGLTDTPVLSLVHLADPAVSADQLHEELAEFASAYRAWYVGQLNTEVPEWGREAAERVLGRIGAAVSRIESGVRTLCDPRRPELLRAFRAANHAMALQMRHSAADLAGTRRPRRDDGVPPDPQPYADARWRPFQLAFFLLAVGGAGAPPRAAPGRPDQNKVAARGGKYDAEISIAQHIKT
ncbi:helicase-related protein, partial [Streptomyces sp. NPDC003522]